MAEPARQLSDDAESDITPEFLRNQEPSLHAIRGGGEGDGVPRGKLHSVPDAPLGEQEKAAGNSNSEVASGKNGGGSEDSFYNPNDTTPRRQRAAQWLKRNRKKVGIWGVVVGALSVLGIGGFSALQPFKLAHFMENIDRTAFGRYQVDLRGRSTKWLQAYMTLRLAEVDDPKLAPQDRDNILFRSNKVDNNKPLTDWYRTMRASKFESQLFESEGIKFTSVAYKDGNITKFRPGIISINDNPVKFDLTTAEINAIDKGNVNGFNGRLNRFVDVQVFNNDKEGRAAVKQLVDDHYKGWWNAIKRYHVRHDIQNMIGVRNWSFFENTKTKFAEGRIALRNKVITSAFPEDTKSGKFVQCLFGISNCTATTDPANPAGHEFIPDGTKDNEDKTCDTSCDKADQGKPLGDGTGETNLQGAATGEAALGDSAAGAADFLNKLASKIIAKASLLSLLDTLARFDNSLHKHQLTKLIAQAKTAQAIGWFTVYAVASDQLHTGQVNSGEVNSFMEQFGNPTNSEGWGTVVNPSVSSGSVSAATQQPDAFTPAKDKQEFCSKEHQAQIDKPQNYAAADEEYQYLCPQYQIGSNNNNAQSLEDAWNNGPGFILHPILDAYHKATGGIFSVFNSVVSFVTGPIINGVISALGLTNDVKQVAAWIAGQALSFFGGGSMIDQNTPSGQVGNVVLEGGAALNEATMREQGASSTTAATASLATKNYLAFQQEQDKSASFASRYLALDNPNSLLSRQLFAISNLSLSRLGQDAVGVFGSALAGPQKVLSGNAHAAVDPYAADKFAAIETFDFPPQCLNTNPLDMTPQNSTNADEIVISTNPIKHIFEPDELNWNLMSNKEQWYSELYARVNGNEDLAKQVYNCALLDNTVRGGLGALYGYSGEDALIN